MKSSRIIIAATLVKQKYPDLYKKIEESLDPTIAGSKISTLDKKVLGTFNGELTQA